jgi:hypothetical protein
LVEDPDMKNVTIVKSEYPGRGEFLPYYYLLKDKYVSKALILQDSMFLNTMIKKDSITSYKFLYEFDPNKFGRDIQNIEKILDSTKKPLELKEFLKTDTWRGCWGTCSVITLAFLEKLDAELGISNLVSVIKTRADRMCLERAFGLMCMYMELKENPSIFGKIEDRKVHSVDGKYNFDEYLTYKYDDPIRKVWNGR